MAADDTEILREWLRGLLAPASHGTKVELADFLGLTPDKLSKMIMADGKPRGITAAELCRIVQYFDAEIPVLPAMHPKPPSPRTSLRSVGRRSGTSTASIMGFIGAGAVITPDIEHLPPDGLGDVELPFPVPRGLIGLEVRGSSMEPRYDAGDIVLVWRENQDNARPKDYIGKEVAVRTTAGRRYLKRLARDPGKETYRLLSINEADTPAITGVELEWVSEVYATIRAGQIRRIEKSTMRVRAAKRIGRR